jgi:hypothetical protein
VEDIPVNEASSVLCPFELLFKILPVLSVGIFMVYGAIECGADELVVYIGADSGCRESDYDRGWLCHLVAHYGGKVLVSSYVVLLGLCVVLLLFLTMS